MTVVEWASIVAVVVAVCGSILIPLWLQKRKADADSGLSQVVSWKGLTASLQTERDELKTELAALRKELADADEQRRRQIHDIEVDFERRLAVARNQITDQEVEVAALRRALRGDPPPSL